MRNELVLVVAALAMVACTPLRPLDPGLDAAREDAFAGHDAAGLDAAGLDAARPDAPVPDAPGLDAPGLDAFVVDAPVELADAFAPDAALAPDAFVPAPDAWRAPDAGSLDGLVAWYPFDRTTDATGRGHTLSSLGVDYAGPIATFEPGDRLTTPFAADLDTVVAVSVWVRPAELPGMAARAGLVDRNTYLGLFIQEGGVVRCTTRGAMPFIDSPPSTLVRDRWTHLVCGHAAGRLVLLVDGVAAGSSPSSLPLPSMEPIAIGQNCCDGTDPLTGDLSDVRLWSRAPLASEIAEMVAAMP